jgi:hypothetical protein
MSPRDEYERQLRELIPKKDYMPSEEEEEALCSSMDELWLKLSDAEKQEMRQLGSQLKRASFEEMLKGLVG